MRGGRDVHALTRRSLLLGAVAVPWVAHGETPAPGAMRIVVPYPPGGSTDVIARLVQGELQQRLGATIIIENRPGASGSVGTAAVAKSPPDGTTWLMVFDNHAANPFVLPNLPFDTEKDLDPVLFIGTAPYVVATQPQKPFKMLADVTAAAKARPDTISYGSVGTGSIGHLATVLLAKQSGARLVHVPYRGGGPAMNDAVAGHVDLLVGSTALVAPQVKAGALHAVVQTGKARVAALADVPTVGESGFSRFRGLCLVGRVRARGHAEGCDYALRRRARRNLARTAHLGPARRDPAGDACARWTGGACQIRQRADAGLGRGRARIRHQGRLKLEHVLEKKAGIPPDRDAL
jgi:tripartite-type tricarboxylate transporter receptor subunit TctC